MLLSPPLARVWTPKIKRYVKSPARIAWSNRLQNRSRRNPLDWPARRRCRMGTNHPTRSLSRRVRFHSVAATLPLNRLSVHSGLSATIGHPEKFNEWLASVQHAHGYKHSFIHHPHRYSHLRKFSYILQAKPERPFSGVDSHRNTERMRFLHPVSLLSAESRTLPSDFSLESADCLTLYRTLAQSPSTDVEDFKKLDPKTFFPSGALLKQKDILRYESALKEKLTAVVNAQDAQGSNATLDRMVSRLQDTKLAAVPLKKQDAAVSTDVMFRNLIHLACDLRASGDLVRCFKPF